VVIQGSCGIHRLTTDVLPNQKNHLSKTCQIFVSLHF
jgi:hypothetical protein